MRVCTLLVLLAWASGPVQGQSWLMVEARDIPPGCAQPMACMAEADLVQRNLYYLPGPERASLLDVLDRLATLRDVPGPAQSVVAPADMISIMHSLPKAEKLATLFNHPGVYFDSTRLDGTLETANFSAYLREELSRVGVRFLSKEELEVTPGRPVLKVSFSAGKESAGCIIPFSLSMSITEEVVMVRNPALKITAPIWSAYVRQNLANLNYSSVTALTEIVETFVTDWTSQNS